MESKSFKISKESVQGKAVKKIVERGQGFSSWIRFGERGLAWLLVGLEACYKGKFRVFFRRVWNEGGRGYKLELHSTKAGRFLLCSALSIEEKSFSLVFPEGKEFLRGWKILATKLRSIGAVPEPRLLEASKEFIWELEEKGEPL